MPQRTQPALLSLRTSHDLETLNLHRFANEASVAIELIPNPILVKLLDKHGFTKRGVTSWSTGTTEATSVFKFATDYIKEFLPNTLVTPSGGTENFAASAIQVFNPLNIGKDDETMGSRILQGDFFTEFGGRVSATVKRHLREEAWQPDILAERRTYAETGHYNYGYNNNARQRAEQRQNILLTTSLMTLAGVLISENNNTVWVRLVAAKNLQDTFPVLFRSISFPRMRNVENEFVGTVFYKPYEIEDILDFSDAINRTVRNTFFSEENDGLLDTISKLNQSIMVGYAPGNPASTLLSVGHQVNAGDGWRKDRSLSRFLDKYKNSEERDGKRVKAHKVSMADVLEAQEKFGDKIDFLIHPALDDIARMSTAKSYEDNDKLMKHQKPAVGLHLSTSIGYLNACSTGLGKTIMILAALQAKAKLVPYYRGLIVCEANVRTQWAEEAEKWFPEAEVCVIGTGKDEDNVINALASEKPVLIILSYTHSLLALEEQEKREAERAHVNSLVLSKRIEYFANKEPESLTIGALLLDTTWDDLCADEAVAIRNANSKQNTIMWQLRQNSKVAVALTATPVNKSPDDIANLLSWARNDRQLFSGDKPLSERYDTTNPKEAKKLYDSFGPLVYRVDAGELGGAIPKVNQVVELLKPSPAEKMLANAAEKELKRVYNELVEALDEVDSLKGGTVDADELANAKAQLKAANGAWLGGTTLARMATSDPLALLESQSVGASLLVGQGLVAEAIKQIPTKRAKFMSDVTQRIARGQQVLVFVSYSTVADLLVQHLQEAGINAKSYTGKNAKSRDKARIEFQNGDLDVLVATQAAERGLTLHKAAAIYHYDLPWTLEKIIQRTGRTVRIGSEHKEVDIIFLILQDTVEERVANHLVKAGISASLIMDASRGTNMKNTETVAAMSGLMTTMARTQSGKSAVEFGKMVLGLK